MLRLFRHLAYEGLRHAGFVAECWCMTGEHLGAPEPYWHLIATEHPLCPIHTSAGRALQASHRPTILTDRCAPPDTTPPTTAPAADTTPAPPTSRATPARGTSALTCHFPSHRATPARVDLGGTS